VVRVPGYRSRGPGFDSWRYQIFWEVVGLERVPLSLTNITEELLEWKNSGFGSRKSRLTGRGDPLRWPHDSLYPQKLALTSRTCGGRSVCIVRLWTKATEFRLILYRHYWILRISLLVNAAVASSHCKSPLLLDEFTKNILFLIAAIVNLFFLGTVDDFLLVVFSLAKYSVGNKLTCAIEYKGNEAIVQIRIHNMLHMSELLCDSTEFPSSWFQIWT
jgi:hypothetical protein